MIKDMFSDMFKWPLEAEQIILFSVVALVLLVAILVLVISTVKARGKSKESLTEKTEKTEEVYEVETEKEVKAVPAAKKSAPKKVQATKPAANKTNDAEDYFVIQNNNTKSPHFKKWRVKKEHSTKTIKHFETQQEAIEFANDLANKSGSKVVVHKVDGTVRN